MGTDGRRSPAVAVRSWPLLVLAAPAAVAVWSGWVGIGEMTGFGMVRPLPGIFDSLRVDTAITLPLGVEAYAAFALRAWLTGRSSVGVRTRRFARWSAIASLVLGMFGQVAYHLLAQSGAVRAPWAVTTLVSCLPVLVLGMGAALTHLLHADAADPATGQRVDSLGSGLQLLATDTRPATLADQDQVIPDRSGSRADRDQETDKDRPDATGLADEQARLAEVRSTATRIAASGQRVSRRTLRAAGVRGSNAELGGMARRLGSFGPNPQLSKLCRANVMARRPGGGTIPPPGATWRE
jgi:hypothetical protein